MVVNASHLKAKGVANLDELKAPRPAPNRCRIRVFLLLLMAAPFWGCTAGPEPSPAADRAYLILGTRAIRPQPPVAGFYIAGEVGGGHFQPVGEIQGDGAFGSEGHPGWLELTDLTLHGAETGRAPLPPYVEGRLGDDGVFRPASRKVNY
ncbi:MAG: hypothetical protein GY953_59185 [bacterium]|nr:hypothetical protein [bacterium]